MSRRARGLAVWATLAAYGRSGYRSLVERHVRRARRLGDQVQAVPDFELLEEPGLNVVCFRYRPDGVPENSLDDLNRRLGQAVIFGTTVYAGKVAFRPAMANWRTTQAAVDLLLPVTRTLGARLHSPARAS
jgi:glutamate/tyrosine decarboxylase-like PLP-dependent enzyme